MVGKRIIEVDDYCSVDVFFVEVCCFLGFVVLDGGVVIVGWLCDMMIV